MGRGLQHSIKISIMLTNTTTLCLFMVFRTDRCFFPRYDSVFLGWQDGSSYQSAVSLSLSQWSVSRLRMLRMSLSTFTLEKFLYFHSYPETTTISLTNEVIMPWQTPSSWRSKHAIYHSYYFIRTFISSI